MSGGDGYSLSLSLSLTAAQFQVEQANPDRQKPKSQFQNLTSPVGKVSIFERERGVD